MTYFPEVMGAWRETSPSPHLFIYFYSLLSWWWVLHSPDTHPPSGSSVVLLRSSSLQPLLGPCATIVSCEIIRRLLAPPGSGSLLGPPPPPSPLMIGINALSVSWDMHITYPRKQQGTAHHLPSGGGMERRTSWGEWRSTLKCISRHNFLRFEKKRQW